MWGCVSGTTCNDSATTVKCSAWNSDCERMKIADIYSFRAKRSSFLLLRSKKKVGDAVVWMTGPAPARRPLTGQSGSLWGRLTEMSDRDGEALWMRWLSESSGSLSWKPDRHGGNNRVQPEVRARWREFLLLFLTLFKYHRGLKSSRSVFLVRRSCGSCDRVREGVWRLVPLASLLCVAGFYSCGV